MVPVNPILRSKPMGGFSLVELMLSLSLGLALSGVMLQGLMAEGQNGARFSRLLRERAAQRRTLELVKQDLAQATAVSETPELEQHGIRFKPLGFTCWGKSNRDSEHGGREDRQARGRRHMRRS